ncbi:class I SAM-dependent methyltransferase [Candidatus Finniella inopinata]|uniref:Class I SAM-dependent methyltransferase n=1 Tax=Candidatus Finniella inopinata TaxID=1696036 RepID=A0A4Q7DER0_9PROT|nr:class I SAM-dependent methyltransferase [Candidatus Finniella inopinata]RZI45132.1 class I SAM-dependent methyltransferase [Candidatus Finniella inopinata]
MSNQQQASFCYESIEPGYYDAIYKKGTGIQSQWHRLKFARVQKSLPESVHNLLDVGCGPGTFLGNFLPSSVKGIGVDIAASQIEFAKNSYDFPHLNFICIKDYLPFDNDFFDVVTCIELIEHLSHTEFDFLLKEMKRVLKPGGILLLTTPNYAGAWPVVEFMVNKLSPVSYAHQHISKFRTHSLQTLLQKAGFKVTVERYMGLAPFSAVFSDTLCHKISNWEQNTQKAYGMLLFALAEKL